MMPIKTLNSDHIATFGRLLEALVPASTSTANAPAPTPSSAAAFPSLGSVPLSPRRGGAIKPPSNDTPASQQKSGVSSTGIIRQQDSVLSTATLQQMASVQFTDPSKVDFKGGLDDYKLREMKSQAVAHQV